MNLNLSYSIRCVWWDWDQAIVVPSIFNDSWWPIVIERISRWYQLQRHSKHPQLLRIINSVIIRSCSKFLVLFQICWGCLLIEKSSYMAYFYRQKTTQVLKPKVLIAFFFFFQLVYILYRRFVHKNIIVNLTILSCHLVGL